VGSKYEKEPGKWVLRVYAGRDGNRDQYLSRVVRGSARQAERALARFQIEVDERRNTRPTQTGTVGELLWEYYELHPWKSTGAKRKCREDLELYLLPHLGSIKLVRFDEKPIERLYRGLQASGDECLAARGKPLSNATVRRLDKTLRAALNWGVRRKRVGWNPAGHVDVPAEPPSKIVVPEAEEIPLMLRSATREFATFVRVAVATGRRREDLLALRLTDVKTTGELALVFDERVVLQKKDLVLTANRRRILEALAEEAVIDPAGGAARRLAERTGHQTVPALTRGLFDLERDALITRKMGGRRTYHIEITDEGRASLGQARATEKASGVLVESLDKNRRTARVSVDAETIEAVLAHVRVMEDRAKAVGTRLRRDAFVFSDHPEGAEPWRPDSTSRRFARLMKQLRMPYTLHCLRHYHVTELLTGGVDVETVARRVGDDPQTIYRVYSHFRPSADTRAATLIGSRLNTKPPLKLVQ
jgi:integrase